MKLSNVDCEIDVDEILSELAINTALDSVDLSGTTTDDDVIELIKEKLSIAASYKQYQLELQGSVILSNYDIQQIDDEDLIEAIEDKGYTILDSDTFDQAPLSGPPQNLFEELCNQFDLPRAATSKQELIKHINSLL